MKHLSLLFSFILLPLFAGAETVIIDNVYYIIDTGAKKATVTRGPNPYFGEINIPATIEYKWVTYDVTSIGDLAFSKSTDLTAVTIPESVTSIESGAFEYCHSLKEIIIPEKVSKIGTYAFNECASLTTITIPDLVEELGNYVFAGCGGLKTINIGKNVTSIGTSTFNNCTGLTTINIPKSVTSIGYNAFFNCNGLTAVHIEDLLAWCTIDFQDNPLLYAGHLYLNGEELHNLIIPNGVRVIGSKVFQGCNSLTSVTIPEGVTTIGSYAFSWCTNITSLSLPNSVTTIGNYAFNDCGRMGSVTIPNGVTKIGEGTFQNCYSMTTITIPESLTEIGENAFNECSGLLAVNISNLAAWCNINFRSNPLYYAHRLYLDGQSLINITVPDGVTRIGDLAFQGGSYIYSVILPYGVTSIGNKAFQGCDFMSTFTMPEGVASIGSGAFQDCSKLRNFYCYSSRVPVTAADAFSGASTYSATLYVPNAAIYDYKATAPWASFQDVRGLYPDQPDKKCETPKISYIKGDVLFSCATPNAVVTSEVKALNGGKSTATRFKLDWAYEISFYASAEGYLDSSVAKAYIRLVKGKPVLEGFSSVVLEPDGGPGDVNSDGIVDVADIATIITILGKK